MPYTLENDPMEPQNHECLWRNVVFQSGPLTQVPRESSRVYVMFAQTFQHGCCTWSRLTCDFSHAHGVLAQASQHEVYTTVYKALKTYHITLMCISCCG